MLNLLFHVLAAITLILSMIIIVLGFLWIIQLELIEMIHVNILWKVEKKVRAWSYGEKKRKTVERVLKRRKGGNSANRKRAQRLKRAVQTRSDKPQEIQLQDDKTTKQVKRGRKKIQLKEENN